MGFMKFMGKDKNKELDDSLDIPPPPPIESAELEQSSPPKIPEPKKDLFPSLPKEPLKETTPPVKHDFDIPPISVSSKGFEEPKPKPFDELLKPIHKEEKPKPLFGEKTRPPIAKPIFVEVTKYKQILKDLNNLKKSLKESNEEVTKIVGDISIEEKTFSTLHQNLSNVEKKLVQLEQSLFSN